MQQRRDSRAEQAAAAGPRDVWSRLPRALTGAQIAAAAPLLAALATLAGAGIAHWLPLQSIGLVYLLAVVVSAVGLGTATGLAVAALSFLAYNFFFIPPVYTFTIADSRELFALFVFLAVALLTGSLAGRMREVADAARRRALALQSLNDFAARLSASRGEQAILEALANQAAATLGGHAIVLVRDGDEPKAAARVPPELELDTADWQAARRVLRSGETAYPPAPGWQGSRAELHAVRGKGGVLGVLGILPDDSSPLGEEARSVLAMLLQHTAIALERTEHERAAVRARDDSERERLRAALLSSLSHDLRTPLASILGAVTSLRQLGQGMSEATRQDLLAAIEEEAGRLSRFVTNLLQMTRLEAGGIDLLADWIDLADVTRSAVERARQLRPAPIVRLSIPAGLPMMRGDATLLEHVVFNLLENSVKFSEGQAQIEVRLDAHERELLLSVSDRGRGISASELPRMFEPFFQARRDGGGTPGAGLGLAIAKRIVEGMGGSMRIESPLAGERGARVNLALPLPQRSPTDAGSEDH